MSEVGSANDRQAVVWAPHFEFSGRFEGFGTGSRVQAPPSPADRARTIAWARSAT